MKNLKFFKISKEDLFFSFIDACSIAFLIAFCFYFGFEVGFEYSRQLSLLK